MLAPARRSGSNLRSAPAQRPAAQPAGAGRGRRGQTSRTVDALHRYARHELGTTVTDPVCQLSSFRYRATDAGGVVENELCPVYAVRATEAPVLNPDESAESQVGGAA